MLKITVLFVLFAMVYSIPQPAQLQMSEAQKTSVNLNESTLNTFDGVMEILKGAESAYGYRPYHNPHYHHGDYHHHYDDHHHHHYDNHHHHYDDHLHYYDDHHHHHDYHGHHHHHG